MDSLVVSTFWLLWVVQLWHSCTRFWWVRFFHFGRYIPRNGILGHMVILWLTFWGWPNCFPKWLTQFTFPPARYKGSYLSTPSLSYVILCFIVKMEENRKWHDKQLNYIPKSDKPHKRETSQINCFSSGKAQQEMVAAIQGRKKKFGTILTNS